VIIRHEDLRAIGYCNPGARLWFNRKGLDWGEFLQHGVELEDLTGIDDAMLGHVVTQAKKRMDIGR